MKLPEEFVNEGLKIASESTIMGVTFDVLNRDELIAVAAQGWYAYNESIKDNLRTIDMFRLLQKGTP